MDIKVYIQQDTIVSYYDENWRKVASKQQATYFGKTFENESGYWEQRDYYADGTIQMIGIYTDSTVSVKQGQFTWFYKNGQKKTVSTFWNNRLIDEHFEYYENGQVDRHLKFNNFGNIESEEYYKPDGGLSIVTKPKFQGSTNEKVEDYVAQNLKYPNKARRKNIEGQVMIRFTVGVDGKLQNQEILSSPDSILSEEAMRLIKSMPKWKPGNRDGIPIAMSFNLPITFVLD